MRLLLLALLSLAGASADPVSSGPAPHVDERQVLLEFKAGIANWDAVAASRGLAGWSPCSPGDCMPPCNWGGILCADPDRYANGFHVTKLDLGCGHKLCAERLKGTLSASLATLPYLSILELGNNNLSGSLPPEWGLPGTFPVLQILRLNGNRFSGRIPEQWAQGPAFLRLVDFQLSDNQLTGPFPAMASTTTSFVNMQAFNIANNQMTGPLPDFWNRLVTILLVSIAENRFTGTLPPNWGRQGYFYNGTYNNTQAIQFLYMHGNRLTGGVPASWAGAQSFTNLRELTLSGNPLGGTLSMEWGLGPDAFPLLQKFNVSNANLSGRLPFQWGTYGGLASLRTLAVTGNSLTGSVPKSWEQQLPHLQHVTIQPGNPNLCAKAPAGVNFKLCMEGDDLCYLPLVPSENATACGSESDDDSGFPVFAVVVPVAVMVMAAAATFMLWWWRRRRLQMEQKRALALQQQLQQQQSSMHSNKPPSEGLQEELNLAMSNLPPPDGRSPQPFVRTSTTSIASAAVASVKASRGGSTLFCYPCGCSRSSEVGVLEAVPSDTTAASGNPNSVPLWLPHAGPPGVRGGRVSPLAQLDQQAAQFYSVPLSPMQQYEQQQAQFYSTPLMPLPGTQPQYQWQQSGSGSGSSYPNGGNGGSGWPVMARRPLLQNNSGDNAVSGGSGIVHVSGTTYHSSFSQGELDLLMRDWDIPPETIQICKRPDGSNWHIGSGSFGAVFKAMRNGVQPVAVKVVQRVVGDAQNIMSNEEFAREVSILRSCRDTNILQFQGVCFQGDRTLLVTEYMEGGNLAHNLRAKTVSWHRRGKKVAIDVARGLVYLHSRRILHLDIKSANVLLTRDGTAKVGDVGMAKIMAEEYVSGTVGTLAWSAPELLLGQRCDTKADIYSFGVLLWEIVTGEVPLCGQLRDPQVPDECPPVVSTLIDRCLSRDRGERPTATELVELLQRCPAVAPGGALPRRSPSLATAHSGSTGRICSLPPGSSDAALLAVPSPCTASLDGGRSLPPRAASLDGVSSLPPPSHAGSTGSAAGMPLLPEQQAVSEQQPQQPASGGSMDQDMRGPFAALALQRQPSGSPGEVTEQVQRQLSGAVQVLLQRQASGVRGQLGQPGRPPQSPEAD